MKVREVYFNFVWDHMCIGLIWDAMGFGTYYVRLVFLGCMITVILWEEDDHSKDNHQETGAWLDEQLVDDEETTRDQN